MFLQVIECFSWPARSVSGFVLVTSLSRPIVLNESFHLMYENSSFSFVLLTFVEHMHVVCVFVLAMI